MGKITGVDWNEGMVKQAKQKTAHLTNVQVHIGNVLSLPFSDQQFDGVICDQVKNTLRINSAVMVLLYQGVWWVFIVQYSCTSMLWVGTSTRLKLDDQLYNFFVDCVWNVLLFVLDTQGW